MIDTTQNEDILEVYMSRVQTNGTFVNNNIKDSYIK
jgi:hypothetical protein